MNQSLLSSEQTIAVVLHDLSGGGTEHIALRLAHAWQRIGRNVVVLCGDATGPLRYLSQKLELVTPPRPIQRGFGSRRRLGRWVEIEATRLSVGALFLPGNYHFPLLDVLGRSAQRPRIVAKLSNTVGRQRQFDHFRPFWHRRLAHRLRHADAVVAMSPALADEARTFLGNLPLAVVPEPIIDDDFTPPPDLPREGFVAAGRFVPQKNFGLLIDAMALLRNHSPRLAIAGDGPELAPLRHRAAFSLDQIRLHGRLPDITPLLRSSRVFVLRSRFEGYPAVLIEALANGCRLVATNCSPAVNEIVNDPTVGETVPPGDAAALARAMERQLGFPPPPPEAMARVVAEHRLRRSAERYLELFDQA